MHTLDHSDIALSGIANIFKKEAADEMEHAQKFIEKLQQRGTMFFFSDLSIFDKILPGEQFISSEDNKLNIEEFLSNILNKAIELEQNVADNVYKIQSTAEKVHDRDVITKSLTKHII